MRKRNVQAETRGDAGFGRGRLQGAGILLGILVLASTLAAQTGESQRSAVSAVEGESWLIHLHRSFDETSMGKTGRIGPPAEDGQGHVASLIAASTTASQLRTNVTDEAMRSEANARVALRGSDLYRMSCRGCHGESGAGAPPEIGSVLNPVRAMSPALVLARMRSLGMKMSAGQAATMAKQSRDALLDRIHKGGQDMPPLAHLNDAEIDSLLVYLQQLAGVPGAGKREIEVTESQTRVGELIVKSTCHVCHDAEGANPTPGQVAGGAIPPLSVLTARVDDAGLIRKVTTGAPVVMGEPATACRGRMPVFFYLKAQEASDVYLYLSQYPPQHEVNTNIATAAMHVTVPPSGENPFGVFVGTAKTMPPAANLGQPNSEAMLGVWLLLMGIGGMAMIGAGCVITVREIQRIENQNARRKAARFVENLAPAMVLPMAALAARATSESAYGRPRESA